MRDTSLPVSALSQHLGFWLRFVSNHVSARFSKLLAEEGVTATEWVALRTVLDQEEASHGSLIQALGMTKGAISKVITRLEKKGLLQRQPTSAGARDQVIILTDAGTRLVPKLARLADQNDEHFFGHLQPQQRLEMAALLQGLVQHHGLKHVPVT